jgi:6-phosphogluconolactonase (cycloisomerase 2 family)
MRNAALPALAAALLCALSCSVGSNRMMPNTYAYIAVYDQTGAGSIGQYRMASTGTLSPMSPATVPAGFSPTGLSIAPGSNHLYALDTTEYAGTFLQFSINSAGTLSTSPLASSGPDVTPYPFTLTPNGRFVLIPALPNGLGTLSSYSISASGALTFVSTVSAGLDPCAVAIDPTGKFAYVADNTAAVILEYGIAADGTLSQIGSISTGLHTNSPYFVGFSPEGFLYSAGCCQLQAVSEYSVDSSTGALTHLNDFPTGDNQSSVPWSIAFDPTGAYAYVTNTDSQLSGYTIASFTVNKSTGALTRNGADTPTVGAYQVAIDPSGKFVFAASQSTVYEFKISSSGTLVSNGTLSLPGTLTEQTSGGIVFAQH